MVTRFAMIWAWLAATACGPQAEDYPFARDSREAGVDSGVIDGGRDSGDGAATDEPLEPWDETGAGPLTGIWAVGVNLNAKVVIDLQAQQIFRFRLLQHGTSLRIKNQLCQLSLPSVPGVAELSIPPALGTVIRERVTDIEGEYLSSATPADAAFSPPAFLEVIGARLADDVNDPLPTTSAPTTATDDDADGHPGVTLGATTVLCPGPEQLYVALKTGVQLTGTVETSDRISGSVVPTLGQSTLGFSADCMAAAAGIAVETRAGSTFLAKRVGSSEDLDGNGNVGCGEVVAAGPSLFADFWAADGGP